MMKLWADIQKLEPGGDVYLFELDGTEIGADLLRFHRYAQTGSILWQGKEYVPWAINAEDFEITGDGQQPAPTLTVGNIGTDENGDDVVGVISALCIYFDDLANAKVIRRRTLAKYLDAENFAEGNPDADPTEEFPQDIYFINQKLTETRESISFELRNALDLNGQQLPDKQVVPGLCWWVRNGGYRGPYCGYTGDAMYDKDGNPTDNPALDDCGGQVSDCKNDLVSSNRSISGRMPLLAWCEHEQEHRARHPRACDPRVSKRVLWADRQGGQDDALPAVHQFRGATRV